MSSKSITKCLLYSSPLLLSIFGDWKESHSIHLALRQTLRVCCFALSFLEIHLLIDSSSRAHFTCKVKRAVGVRIMTRPQSLIPSNVLSQCLMFLFVVVSVCAISHYPHPPSFHFCRQSLCLHEFVLSPPRKRQKWWSNLHNSSN